MRAGVAVAVLLVIESCAYRGPVLPPSPEIPAAITNLTAIERGDRIEIQFTTPPRTTDNLPIKRFESVDLRIGPAVRPFDFAKWAESSTQYELPPPPPNDPDDPKARPMSDSIPVSDWVGKRIAVAVRTAVKGDHFSAWSNVVRLQVVKPVAPPVIKAEATPRGVKITWASEGAGLRYQVFRQGPNDKQPAPIVTSAKPEYVDTAAQFDTAYKYTVVTIQSQAESLPSQAVEITPKNVFPPAVPTGLAALAAPNSIEVSWQRNPEANLKGYYLYRSVNGAPFERQGELLALPVYSDHNVEHGRTYRYEVTAVGQNGLESAKSAPVEAIFQ